MADRPSYSTFGGLAFFSSLIFLWLIALTNARFLLSLPARTAAAAWVYFLCAGAAGAIVARYVITGSLSVLLHEFKHSLVSSLAGNRPKSFRVDRQSGHFEYSYTSQTAHFNALISLAPYTFPFFTLLALGLSALFLRDHHHPTVLALGFALGLDLYSGFRDLSPHQPDLFRIRGGYTVALVFVIGWHAALLTFLAAWVTAGPAGLVHLLKDWLMLAGSILDRFWLR